MATFRWCGDWAPAEGVYGRRGWVTQDWILRHFMAQDDEAAAAIRGTLPPFCVIRDWILLWILLCSSGNRIQLNFWQSLHLRNVAFLWFLDLHSLECSIHGNDSRSSCTLLWECFFLLIAWWGSSSRRKCNRCRYSWLYEYTFFEGDDTLETLFLRFLTTNH